MNRHNNNANTLLVEIMVAVLFFSLCSVVLLRTFVATHNLSVSSAAETKVLAQMRDVAEQLSAADDTEHVLKTNGFTRDDQGWLCSLEDGYTIRVTENREQTADGVMYTADITAAPQGETDSSKTLQLKAARYVPLEVAE